MAYKHSVLDKEIRPFTEKDIVEKLSKINHMRNRAIVSLVYLSGGRISEIIQVRYKDISFTESEGGKPFGIISLPTLKNPNQNERQIPFSLEKEPDKTMISYINELAELKGCEFEKSEERIIQVGARRVEQIFNKYFEFAYPHFMRHCRLTHLGRRGIREKALLDVTGWSPQSFAALSHVYLHYNVQDTAKDIT